MCMQYLCKCICLWMCMHNESVHNFFCLTLYRFMWIFQRPLARSSFPGHGLTWGREDVPCWKGCVSPRLPHCWAVNQLVSLTAQQLQSAASHTPNHIGCYVPMKIVEGLMYVFDRNGQCQCEWSWHLSEWVRAVLLYVFCQVTFKAYIETVKRTYWLQPPTLCTQRLPIIQLTETL